TQDVPEQRVTLVFSPDSGHLITAAREGVQVWDVQSGKAVQTIEKDTGGVHALCFRPDKPQLAMASWLDSQVLIWDWDGSRLREIRALRGESSVESVAYSPDGKWLAGCEKSGFRVWEAETFREVWSVVTPPGKLFFTPDSRTLLVAPLDFEDRT